MMHGQHAQQAERALLADALRDPLNQRFALMSDTSVPLYPPTIVYAQLLSQPSYQDACAVTDEKHGAC